MSSPMFFAYANGSSGLRGGAIRGGRAVETPDGIAHIDGDDVFYLVSLTDGTGNPTPGGQLETLREKTESDGIVTITETVGTGFTKVGGRPARRKSRNGRWYTATEGGRWSLKSVVASRVYSHPKFAKSDEIESAKVQARWLRPDGQVANIWCRLVLCSEAVACGYKLPKLHLRNNRQQGNRAVGYEHGVVSPAQRALSSAPAQEQEVTPETSDLPPMGDVL